MCWKSFQNFLHIFSERLLPQFPKSFKYLIIVTSHAQRYHKADFSKSSFPYGVKLGKICDKMIPYPPKSGEKS